MAITEALKDARIVSIIERLLKDGAEIATETLASMVRVTIKFRTYGETTGLGNDFSDAFYKAYDNLVGT